MFVVRRNLLKSKFNNHHDIIGVSSMNIVKPGFKLSEYYKYYYRGYSGQRESYLDKEKQVIVI